MTLQHIAENLHLRISFIYRCSVFTYMTYLVCTCNTDTDTHSMFTTELLYQVSKGLLPYETCPSVLGKRTQRMIKKCCIFLTHLHRAPLRVSYLQKQTVTVHTLLTASLLSMQHSAVLNYTDSYGRLFSNTISLIMYHQTVR